MSVSELACHSEHPSHVEERHRINRIAGQIEGIKRMIDEQRYCPEILTQLKAVQSALKSVETNILQRHIKCCVKDAFESQDQTNVDGKIEELMALFKRF